MNSKSIKSYQEHVCAFHYENHTRNSTKYLRYIVSCGINTTLGEICEMNSNSTEIIYTKNINVNSSIMKPYKNSNLISSLYIYSKLARELTQQIISI